MLTVPENSMRKDLFCSHPQMAYGVFAWHVMHLAEHWYYAVIAGIGGSLLMVDRKRGERDGKRRGKGRGRRRGGGRGRERRKEGREERDGRHLLGQETAVQDLAHLQPYSTSSRFQNPSKQYHQQTGISHRSLSGGCFKFKGVTLRKIVGSGLPESF